MKVNEKITITLSEEDVISIVKDYVLKKGYSAIVNTNVKVKKDIKYSGYGMEEIEHETLIFEGISLEVKSK